MAMGLQAVHNFELAASMLIDLISEIALPDRANVVSIFSRAYLNQRETLTGGDGEIVIGGHSYPIWLRTPRPLTSIEVSLYTWLRDSSHPVARQVAVQAFAAFAATELERKERAVTPVQPQAITAPVSRPAVVEVARKQRRLRHLSPLAHLAVLAAAPLQRPVRSLLRPVLAEAIGVDSALTVIEKWRTTDDATMQSLARSLRVALSFFRWRWVILLTAALSAVLWYDWRDWNWSHADPLPPVETLQIQMQNALPQRMIWRKWVPRFQQYEAERQAALEAAVLKAAGKQADLLTATEKPPPEPLNRLRRVAELSLTRLSRAQDEDFQKEVLAAFRAEREAARLAALPKDPRLKAAELIAFLRTLPSVGMKTPEQIKAEELEGRIIFERLRKTRGWPTAQSRLVETETAEDAPAWNPADEDMFTPPVEIPDLSIPEPKVPAGSPSWLRWLRHKPPVPPPPLPGGKPGSR